MAKKQDARTPPGRGRVSKTPSSRDASHTRRPTWTFMLYLAGDNNLGDEMVWTLKEIFRVGVPRDVAVTAQLDLPAARGVRGYRPTSALDGDGVFRVLHRSAGAERDSGDPDALVDFIVDSIQTAPADNYMLILAGHGSGVIGDFLTDSDSDQRHTLQPGSLTIPDLSTVFSRLRKRLPRAFFAARGDRPTLDVLGMDSCLMSMAEVCSEIRGQVSLLIGSEGFEPNTGWPYFRLLERLPDLTSADLEPRPLAQRLARRYVTYYSDYTDAGLSVDLSVCDVGDRAMEALEQAVKAFVGGYRLEIAKPDGDWIDAAILLAHWHAQSYKGELYTDLADFFALLAEECDRLQVLARNPADSAFTTIAARARAVASAVDDGTPQVVVLCDTSGPEFQHSRGLSLYFPWSLRLYEEQYRATRFAARSDWDLFLQEHLYRTRRAPREAAASGPTLPGATADEIILVRDPSGGFQHVSVQPGRTSAPSSRTSAPSSRTSAPSSRTSAPSSRTSAPSSRVAPSSVRTSAPSSRFAQDMDSLLRDLPSRMKNPATDVVSVIRVDAATAAAVAALPVEEASPDLVQLKEALAAVPLRPASSGPGRRGRDV